MENFTKTAQFFASLQGLDGGMMEAEDNPFENTDNTLESIWVWCRYFELTGDNTYYQNVLDAWNYSILHPAWLEPDSGKVYSSSWALAAEQRFRNAYNDWTYSWYANASMQFISNVSGMEPNIFLFPFEARVHIRGWAAGNMYLYALDTGNITARWEAVGYGNATMTEMENDPSLLSTESWALAGGTSMWGIWKSSMQEFPDVTWMQTYGPFLSTEVTTPGVGAGNSQVGWEAWYAGGHLGLWDITGEDIYYLNFLNITDRQMAADGDDDGGLPTNYGNPDNTDESWVTSYRAYMILDEFNRMPSGNPPLVSDLQSTELSMDGSDVVLNWSLSGDDGSGEMDVFVYEVFYMRNDIVCAQSLGSMRLGVVFAGTDTYVHSGAGQDLTNYTYHISIRDFQGWRTTSTVHGGKCALQLSSGNNLISIPFMTRFPDVTSLFQLSSLRSVRTYDNTDPANPWKSYTPAKPFNDLYVVNRIMGIWVDVSSDEVLPVAGMVANSTSIPIKTGWNLIGYPFATIQPVAMALGNISYDRVEAYDESSPFYHLKEIVGTDIMQPGKAFWIHALADGAIQIQN